MRQVTHALLTRPPLSLSRSVRKLHKTNSVRLACVKHAASVHPEPGSNSLKKCSAKDFHVLARMKIPRRTGPKVRRVSPSQDQPFLANPSLVYCLGFVQKNVSLLNVRGCVLLFSCQVPVRCLLSEATLIFYHSFFCLSTTFFIFFFTALCCLTRQLVYNITVFLFCQQLFSFFYTSFCRLYFSN